MVVDRASWARCLYVKRDFRLRPAATGEIGEEVRNGCEEDIFVEKMGAAGKGFFGVDSSLTEITLQDHLAKDRKAKPGSSVAVVTLEYLFRPRLEI